MTAERWEQIKALFASALKIRPEDRDAYVRTAAGTDRALFDEVIALLREADQSAAEPLAPPLDLRASIAAGWPRRFSAQLETEYRDEYFRRSLPQVRAALLLAIFLYAIFAVLDASVAPAQRVTLWVIRLVVLSGAAWLYGYSYRPRFPRMWQAGISVLTFIGAVGIIGMIALIPAPSNYLYYAGLLLLTIYYCTVVRLYFAYAATLSIAIFLTYAATAIWLRTPAVILFTHFMMLLAGDILALSANFALDQHNRRDFEQRRTIAARTAALESRNRQLSAANLELVRSHQELHRSARRNELLFAALTEALPGTVLEEKYRLDEKIGAGGFGTVYKAFHLMLERPVAVKLLKPGAGDPLTDVDRFRREGTTACRLAHPNVVSVLDFSVTGGVAYLVMELLEGRSVADELRACGAFSTRRCYGVLEPLCAALSDAHRRGLVHRDLKPSNVFLHRVGSSEVVKIIDFGLATIVESDGGAASHGISLALAGTPGYMAPERLAGQSGGKPADVYSLAVMVWELLTGQPPNRIGARAVDAAADTAKNGAAAVPMSPEVGSVLASALSADPQDRPSIDEFSGGLLQAMRRAIETDDRACRTRC
jgi:hypothetical protein